MAQAPEIAQQIVEIGQRLAQKGFIAGADGNISARISPSEIMVTPSGLPKGRLAQDDLVLVDPAGAHLRGSRRASSELLMHLFVYGQRPDIMACVHSHPPHVTAFAVVGRPLPTDVLPEVVLVVGEIPLTDYAATGTDEVPRALAPYIARDNAFILGNHGLLTIGRTLEEAWARHETVEHYARILLLASQLGDIRALPPAEVTRLRALKEKLFGTTANRAER
ncbi:MAG: class II aldolase/adducin family protein [bacterium]|nr:class II aldolase/adducin family protein [bacterium]